MMKIGQIIREILGIDELNIKFCTTTKEYYKETPHASIGVLHLETIGSFWYNPEIRINLEEIAVYCIDEEDLEYSVIETLIHETIHYAILRVTDNFGVTENEELVERLTEESLKIIYEEYSTKKILSLRVQLGGCYEMSQL